MTMSVSLMSNDVSRKLYDKRTLRLKDLSYGGNGNIREYNSKIYRQRQSNDRAKAGSEKRGGEIKMIKDIQDVDKERELKKLKYESQKEVEYYLKKLEAGELSDEANELSDSEWDELEKKLSGVRYQLTEQEMYEKELDELQRMEELEAELESMTISLSLNNK